MAGVEVIGEAITKLSAPLTQLKADLLAARTEVEAESGGMAAKAQKLGVGIGTAVGAGAVAAGVALFKLGDTFDEQFDKIRVKTGATGDTLKGLEGDFKSVLKNVPESFDQVGDAIAMVNQRLGLSGPTLQSVATQFLNLSHITGTDLATNIDNVTRVFGDWGITVDDQAERLDQLYRASQASGIGFGELSSSVVQFGAPLRNLGFTLDQSLALLAQFNKTGVNTNTVFAGLKKGVGTLAKAGEPVPETFRRIVDEITKLGPGTEATGLAIKLFGQRAGPDLADAIAGGKFKIDDMLAAIDGGKDTINGAAKDTEDFGEAWKKFTNTLAVDVEPVATAVFNGVTTAMEKVGPVLDNDVMPALHDLGSFVTRYKPEFIALAAIIGGALTTAFITWGVQSTIAAGKAVAGFLIAQAQAVASGAIMVAQLAKTIATWVELGIKAIISGGQMAEAWLIGLGPVGAVVAAIAVAAALIVTHWDTILNAAKAVWNWISTNWPLILAILTGPIGLAVLAISRNWDTIKSGVTAAKDWVVARLNDVVSFITGMPGRIASAAAGMWDGIFSAFKAVLNMIIDKWNHFRFPSITFHIPHIPGTNIGGDVTFGGWSLPQIPRLATGGDILRGGLALVGEQGPELMRLPGAATVFNNPTTRSLLSGIGGAVRELEEHIHVSVDGRELFEIIRNRQTELDRHTVGRTRRVA